MKQPNILLDRHSQRLLGCFAIDEYTITPQHIRDARHGYYSAISYIDDKVGQLLHALRATGRDQDTIVIFTSDHGELLGEHNLWYKMSWFEGSARVPLIFYAPQHFAPKRVAAPVSLLDLLPTLVDLATDGAGIPWADPVDGHSLLPLLAPDVTPAAWARGRCYRESQLIETSSPTVTPRRSMCAIIWRFGNSTNAPASPLPSHPSPTGLLPVMLICRHSVERE